MVFVTSGCHNNKSGEKERSFKTQIVKRLQIKFKTAKTWIITRVERDIIREVIKQSTI